MALSNKDNILSYHILLGGSGVSYIFNFNVIKTTLKKNHSNCFPQNYNNVFLTVVNIPVNYFLQNAILTYRTCHPQNKYVIV